MDSYSMYVSGCYRKGSFTSNIPDRTTWPRALCVKKLNTCTVSDLCSIEGQEIMMSE